MKKKKKLSVSWIIFSIVLMLVCIFVLISLIYLNYTLTQEKKAEVVLAKDINEIIAKCDNLLFFDACNCINKEIENIYKYNITNINKKLTFQQLKEEGGVCWHYSEVVNIVGKELGYYNEEVIIDINKTAGHVIAILSGGNDKRGYCWFDNEFVVTVRVE